MRELGMVLALWLVGADLAVTNGYIGYLYIAPRLDEYWAHVYRSLSLVMAAIVIASIYVQETAGEAWLPHAVLAGVLWGGLSTGFEAVVRHYILNQPWSQFLGDYQLREGRLGGLVLAGVVIAPIVLAWCFNR